MSEDSDLFEDPIIRDLIQRVFTSSLQELVSRGVIQLDELDDIQKVREAFKTNPNIMEEVNWIYLIHHQFVNYAKEAFQKNDMEVGIVLLATAIEQIVNYFYREMLQLKGLFTDNNITEIIRSNNIGPKISWLLTLISENSLDSELQSKVLKLMEMRNQIVHYKAIPLPNSQVEKSFVENENIPFGKKLKSISVEELNSIPDELYAALNEIANDMVEKFSPEYIAAKHAINQMMEDNENKNSAKNAT